jgi:hypothetical protein
VHDGYACADTLGGGEAVGADPRVTVRYADKQVCSLVGQAAESFQKIRVADALEQLFDVALGLAGEYVLAACVERLQRLP